MPERGTTAANRPGDEAVKAKTGKTWGEWFEILDKAGAVEMSHKEIVALLHERHQVGPWWQQMVTVGYEQERGMRALHEKPGGYEISRSKTIEAPVDVLFEAWSDEAVRRRWLADPDVEIRKATPGKSLRITWADGKTHVNVNFYPKGEKTQVTVQHTKLADGGEAEHFKAYWEVNLARLKEALQPQG